MQWQQFSYPFHTTAAATTLTISDITGLSEVQGTALDALAVSELPPGQQTQILLNTVNSLVGPVLNAGNENALTSKLNAALAQINSGNQTAAANQLGAFINPVNALVQSGRLAADLGQTLVSSAQAIIDQLNA
jgi:GH24 family phage-related lysozyme (muramidase)